MFQENEVAYISLGAGHRLSNPEKVYLEIIEVHSGSYLGKVISRELTMSMVEPDRRYGRIISSTYLSSTRSSTNPA